MGLKDREWGQMGVIMMAGTLGWIMEAPAAAAYAVLPVGVDTMTPGTAKRAALNNQGLLWGTPTHPILTPGTANRAGTAALITRDCSGGQQHIPSSPPGQQTRTAIRIK